MIEPFCLHEGSKDAAQAEAMRKAHPWKITDEELSSFEEKVKPLTPRYLSLTCSAIHNLDCFGVNADLVVSSFM